jgi:hypothetical protein
MPKLLILSLSVVHTSVIQSTMKLTPVVKRFLLLAIWIKLECDAPCCYHNGIIYQSVTSRILRKEFEFELKPHFKNWNKGLWGDQLYIRSAGGAPLKILEEYIQSHTRG